MYCSAFREFVYIILAGLCSANEQTYPFARFSADYDVDDFACSGSGILFSKRPVNRVACVSLCENKNQCAGFTYRVFDKTCVGCKSGPASNVSGEPGMVFFAPTEGEWGSTCSAQYACTGDNLQCMDGVCVCSPGYSFNATSWTYDASCDIYGETFQKYQSKFIVGNNLECLTGLSVDQCFQECRDTTSCRSIDYSPFVSRCCVQAVTPLEVPEAYANSSTDDYYNRNC